MTEGMARTTRGTVGEAAVATEGVSQAVGMALAVLDAWAAGCTAEAARIGPRRGQAVSTGACTSPRWDLSAALESGSGTAGITDDLRIVFVTRIKKNGLGYHVTIIDLGFRILLNDGTRSSDENIAFIYDKPDLVQLLSDLILIQNSC